MADVYFMKLFSDDCPWSLPMISQNWVWYWLGAIKQQAIIRANVDTDLCPYIESLGHI